MKSFSSLFFPIDWLIFYVRRHLKIRLIKTVYYTKASIIRDAILHINICRINTYLNVIGMLYAERNTRTNHLYEYILLFILYEPAWFSRYSE